MTELKYIRATSLRLHHYASTPPFPMRLSRWLAGALVVFFLCLAFVPWRQSVRGAGRVVAYSPTEREQYVSAPVPGRIIRWHVVEGSRVQAGDPIVEMADIDPSYLERIEQRLQANRDRIEAAQERLTIYQAQVQAYEEARQQKVEAMKLKAKMATQEIAVAHQKASAAEATLQTTKMNLERLRGLVEKGIASQRQLELAELDFAKAEAAVKLSQAKVLEAEANRLAAQAEIAGADAEGGAKVATSLADIGKAEAEAAYARGDVAKLEVERARQLAQTILAPVDGTIVQIDGNLGGGVVKAGEVLAKLVPDTDSRAAELFVSGNDAPLISDGKTVRLQFEGWPALQFVGFPGAAVGTYGGIVSFVNPAATDAEGRVRVLVVPDPNDRPWPEPDLLRQQVRAKAWFLLDQVSLGWEIWRNINGFPPSLAEDPRLQLDEDKQSGQPVTLRSPRQK